MLLLWLTILLQYSSTLCRCLHTLTHTAICRWMSRDLCKSIWHHYLVRSSFSLTSVCSSVRLCCAKLNEVFPLLKWGPCSKDTASDWSLKHGSMIAFLLSLLIKLTEGLVSLLRVVLVYVTWAACRPSLSGYSWSAKLPNILSVQQMFPTKRMDTETIRPKLVLCLWFLWPQHHLVRKPSLFCIYLFFVYCEVTMDWSSVNVAKGNHDTLVPVNYCVTIKGKQMTSWSQCSYFHWLLSHVLAALRLTVFDWQIKPWKCCICWAFALAAFPSFL